MKTIVIITAAMLAAGGANAATTAFSLTFDDPTPTNASGLTTADINVPIAYLTNTGDMGDITKFTLALGDLSKNFDFGRGYTVGYALTGTNELTFTRDPSVDRDSGGARADSLSFSFTDFNPGESFAFKFDIDADFFNSFEDYRTSLLDGGNISVEYGNSPVVPSHFVAFSAPDATLSSYTFGASDTIAMDMAAVPLPAGLPLLLAGLGGLAFLRRKKS